VTEALELLRELADADEAHRATLAELDALLARETELRARADHLSAFLAAAPGERQRLAQEAADAEAAVEQRARSLAEAEAELAEAERRRDRERLLAARRFQVRAADASAMAEKHLAAARDALSAHERAVESAEFEAPELEQAAARLAVELAGAPRVPADAAHPPEPGLDGVRAWATGARAVLVVARGGVTSERDALIRQATELASLLLGEPQVATSAAAAADRVERSLAR
jgi:hypothetical protein